MVQYWYSESWISLQSLNSNFQNEHGIFFSFYGGLPQHNRQFGFPFGAVTAALGAVTSSEVSRPDLHLGAFGGVVIAFPAEPVHAVSVRRVLAMEVQGVQVGVVASVVPPGAFEPRGAVPPIVLVVVSVFGAESHRIVIPQWITRCTYE